MYWQTAYKMIIIGTQCTDPGVREGVTQVHTTYKAGDTVTYTCDRNGYDLDPNNPYAFECILNNANNGLVWNNTSPPTCVGKFVKYIYIAHPKCWWVCEIHLYCTPQMLVSLWNTVILYTPKLYRPIFSSIENFTHFPYHFVIVNILWNNMYNLYNIDVQL